MPVMRRELCRDVFVGVLDLEMSDGGGSCSALIKHNQGDAWNTVRIISQVAA